ncbi:beta/gamma crystallin domain-containing protein [Amycolatopsis samaneae]|uniref:Beta/gamma crystallin domain-containing protein n=1 Tax=Amycolatopsis samaneae TaxID=664691 RepID=A0ABW5GU22_9PSEU
MKKTLAAGAVAALSATGMLVSGSDAFAINRVTCNENGYTWLNSTDTTCWANRGTIGVTLYGVYSVSSGNNTGWVASPSGYVDFPQKWNIYQFSSRRIDTIHIN